MRAHPLVDHAELVWRLLEGRTQQQIADGLGFTREAVTKVLGKIQQECDLTKIPEKPFHFDIWNGISGDGKDYFGAMPEAIVENLLHFYTEPGQIVFDPFAGSGSQNVRPAP